ELLAAWLLEKNPERRPKSAEDVIHALDRLGIVPEHKIDTPRRSDIRKAIPKAPSMRPVIVDPDLAMSVDEGDTFEPDTDSAIPKDEVKRALAELDEPSEDRVSEPRDPDPERAVPPGVVRKSTTNETEQLVIPADDLVAEPEIPVYEDKTPKKR